MNFYINWGFKKLGTGFFCYLDEIKFQGEVVAEYMEWDDKSQQKKHQNI